MKIFITGASGFVGGAIGKKLAAEHRIYAMARSERSAQKVRDIGLTPVMTELNKVSIADLMEAEVVIHSAAYVEAWGSKKQYWDLNVEGTRQLLEIARAAGVKRFIHISTEACLFYGQPMDDIDETYPYADDSPYPYSMTKAAAERSVLKADEPGVFETIAIRPRMVWGPGDQTILPEVVKMIDKGAFVWVNHGSALTSITHIDNLVHGVELALDKGIGGSAYFITDDEVLTLKQFLSGLLASRDIVPTDKSIPSFVLRPAAFVIEKIWRALSIKKEPPLTRFAADMMSVSCTLRIDKAQKELGYRPIISVQEGMRQLR